MYKVRVIVKGEQVDEFETNGENAILTDAIFKDVDLPYSCQVGLCETCHCQIEGETESNMDSLVDGYKLTCKTKAKSDITLNYD